MNLLAPAIGKKITSKRYFSNAPILPLDITDKIIDIFERNNIPKSHISNSENKPLDIFSKKESSGLVTRSIDLQLTSTDRPIVINYAEFCHQVACLMGFNSSGPLALRYDVKKWSILRSPFVHKTSFKQYERRCYKRLVRISNAHPALHQKFLWYVQHHLPSEVEFSSTIFEYEPLNNDSS